MSSRAPDLPMPMIASDVASTSSAGNGASRRATSSAASSAAPARSASAAATVSSAASGSARRQVPCGQPQQVVAVPDPQRDPRRRPPRSPATAPTRSARYSAASGGASTGLRSASSSSGCRAMNSPSPVRCAEHQDQAARRILVLEQPRQLGRRRLAQPEQQPQRLIRVGRRREVRHQRRRSEARPAACWWRRARRIRAWPAPSASSGRVPWCVGACGQRISRLLSSSNGVTWARYSRHSRRLFSST